jgi:DNA-binding IclR family transcriptional regulator
MLSVADEELVSTVLRGPLEPMTPNTIRDPEELSRELAICRKRGYAVDNMESQSDVRCVAAPIFNSLGHVFAAISIAGPAFRITEDRLEELGAKVMRVTELISREMGYDRRVLTG